MAWRRSSAADFGSDDFDIADGESAEGVVVLNGRQHGGVDAVDLAEFVEVW